MDPAEGYEGRTIGQKYRLTSRLGQGGMGSVWRAEHLDLGSEVAVKLIGAAVADDPAVQARFVREAKAAAQLRGPHVVQIFDYGVDEGTPYIAMELMQGESLAERLERMGRLTAEQTARIVTEIARALTKAHEAGIIHRDLKPDNVFLVHNDDTEVAKVLDFGVAKQHVSDAAQMDMTSTGALVGTPYYMSPEQTEGLKTLDHRTDIWALAVIAYECLVGDRPFQADTLGGLFLAICTRDKPVPSSRVDDLPDGFDEWFYKGTARDVHERFQSAREAARSLRAIVAGDPDERISLRRVSSPAFEATVPHSSSSAELAGPRPGDVVQRTTDPKGSPPLTTTGVGAVSQPIHESRSRKPLLLGVSVIVLGGVGSLLWGASGRDATEPTERPAEIAAPQGSSARDASNVEAGLATAKQGAPPAAAPPLPTVRAATVPHDSAPSESTGVEAAGVEAAEKTPAAAFQESPPHAPRKARPATSSGTAPNTKARRLPPSLDPASPPSAPSPARPDSDLPDLGL